MIRLKHRHDINEVKWNLCIDHSHQRQIYAYVWYLDQVAERRWFALVEDDYKAVMPFAFNRKFGFLYMYQPFFCQQLGYYSRENVTNVDAFLEEIPTILKYWDVNLNYSNETSFPTTKKSNYILRLNVDYEVLAKGYSKNLKRNLSKATNCKLQSEDSKNYSSMIKLFRADKGDAKGYYRGRDYARLKRLLEILHDHRTLYFRTVNDERGKPIAAAAFTIMGSQLLFLFSGNSEAGREVAAVPFLIDEFIRLHAGSETYLDFNGTMDPNLARFYRSFGSQETVYLNLRRNLLPAPFRWFKN